MSNAHQYLQKGEMLDYTPAAIVTAGKLVQIGALSAFCPTGIAAAALGAACVEGVIRGPYDGGVAGNVGDNVWWDDNGTPYGGAATGSLTLDATLGDWWVGTLVRATAAAGTTCDVALNKVNPNLPAWQNRSHVKTAVDLTFVAATHNGMVIHVTADAKTLTMPVGVAGMEVILQNDVVDAGAKVSLDFNGNETLQGRLTIAATKQADLTKLTSIRGDFLHIRCSTAAGIWVVLGMRGTWVTST